MWPVGTCIEFVISALSKVLVRDAFATSVLLGVRPVGTCIEYVISAHSKVLVRDAFATSVLLVVRPVAMFADSGSIRKSEPPSSYFLNLFDISSMRFITDSFNFGLNLSARDKAAALVIAFRATWDE